MTAPAGGGGNGVTAGAVWIDVLPSVRNFGPELARQLGGANGAAAGAGAAAGQSFSKAMGVAAVGAAAIAAGKALYSVGKVFDDMTDTIRVGTGATGKNLDSLVASAKNVGRTVPANFGDIGNAVADLNTRLGLTGKPLEAMATQFLNLSRITGTDLQVNIEQMTRVFGDWGIAADQQAGALDKIYRASQATGVGIDSLAQNAVKFGGPMRQLGFSFDQTLALLGKFGKEGVNTELVMGSMRIALGKMARAGEEPISTLNRVIGEIKGAGDAGKANALALELFGARAGPDMAAAIREGRFEIGDLVGQISNGSDTINTAAADTADFAETWQILKNHALLALEPVARRVFAGMAEFATWMNTTGIPAIKGFARGFWDDYGPAIELAGNLTGRVLGVFMDLLKLLWDGRNIIIAVGAGLAVLVGPLVAIAAATAVWSAAVSVAATVTRAWAIAQAFFNIVMAANPITLVVVALVALGVALVVAYKRSETFRAIVQATWEAIQKAALYAWENILKPTFAALVTAYQTSADVAVWLWRNIIQPVWSGISSAIDFAVTAIGMYLDAVKLYFRLMGDSAMFLWNNVISPAWDGIRVVVDVVRGAIDLYIQAIQLYFRLMGDSAMFLWNNMIRPAWDGIMFVVDTARAAIDLYLQGVRFYFQLVGDSAMFLWNNGIKPAWDGIGGTIGWVVDNVITPAFNRLRDGVNGVKTFFTETVDGIRWAWNQMKDIVKAPVNFFIREVWNNGLVKAWNKMTGWIPVLGDKVKLEPLGEILANSRGGVIPGYTPGRDPYVSLVSGGEAVMRPEWTSVVGHDYVHAANKAARRGGKTGVREFINSTSGMADPRAEGRAKLALMQRFPLDGLFHAFAYGGVAPHVAAAGDEITRLFGRMPGGIGGVGSRSNPSDHPSGHALDFMTLRDKALGDRVASHLLANARRMMVKYLIWQQQSNDGRGWKQMEDRGSITANHFDHVHASFLRAGLLGKDFSSAGGGGGMFDWFGKILEHVNPVRNLIDPWFDKNMPGGGPFREVFQKLPHIAVDAFTDWVRDQAMSVFGVVGSVAGNVASSLLGGGKGVPASVMRWAPVVETALGVVGQPVSRYLRDTTLLRMNKESSGNPNAINRTDINARLGTPSVGLMQVIGPTYKRYHHPAHNRPPHAFGVSMDPLSNIVASMRYALGRYGSLPNAYNRPGGYDDGGYMPPGIGVYNNATRKPEPVFSHEQWEILKGNIRGGDGDSPLVAVYPAASHDEVTIGNIVANRIDFQQRTAPSA